MKLRTGPVQAVCGAVLILTAACGAGSSGASAPGTPGSGVSGPSTQAPGTSGDGGLARLVDLAAQRLATADAVAASKWASGGSISDPAREKVVLDAAATGAGQRGLDPHDVDGVSQVFRDQIEANKAVQYGLFSDWSADPEHVPAVAPDLARVRPVLDGITGQLLDALAATRAARSDPGCPAMLGHLTVDLEHDQHLDELHGHGLDRAVRSICA